MRPPYYCPICFRQLTAHYDCWVTCQYEVHHTMPPLTQKQALEGRINNSTARLKILKNSVKDTKTKINDLNTELEKVKINLTLHTVKKVTSEPYFKYLWCVDVVAESWGNQAETTVHCQTEEQAKQVKPGYQYEA